MKRFFFDTLDEDNLIIDDEGIELPNLEAAQEEAARSLADLLEDDTGNKLSNVSIQVRDDEGLVLEAKFVRPTEH